MTHKKRAEILLTKFRNATGVEGKECALICADEIISALKKLNQSDMRVKFETKHWEWTKEEIQKL